MKEQDMSEFLNDRRRDTENASDAIDFSEAKQLPGGGSTCDLFRTRWQRREVFVKRLKPEYRDKPLYLDALDKEYDVGVSLSHPSLPEYRALHRDYLVMDFIDGATLAEMIRFHDPWLSDRQHIVCLLRQLVEAVDYLHRRNVTHCDIKPDNIMITHNGRNLVLIDFDKSYTDALNDTSGHPHKHGVSLREAGSVRMDFHGIGRVAERICKEWPEATSPVLKRFVKACYAPDTDCQRLLAILDRPHSSYRKWFLAAVGLMILAGMIYLYVGEHSQPMLPDTMTTTTDSLGAVARQNATTDSLRQQGLATPKEETKHTPPAAEGVEADGGQGNEVAISDEEIYRTMLEVIAAEIAPGLDSLSASLDSLATLKSNTSLTRQERAKALTDFEKKEESGLTEMWCTVKETFPEFSPDDASAALAATPAFRDYMRRAWEVKKGFR